MFCGNNYQMFSRCWKGRCNWCRRVKRRFSLKKPWLLLLRVLQWILISMWSQLCTAIINYNLNFGTISKCWISYWYCGSCQNSSNHPSKSNLSHRSRFFRIQKFTLCTSSSWQEKLPSRKQDNISSELCAYMPLPSRCISFTHTTKHTHMPQFVPLTFLGNRQAGYGILFHHASTWQVCMKPLVNNCFCNLNLLSPVSLALRQTQFTILRFRPAYAHCYHLIGSAASPTNGQERGRALIT